MNAKQQSELFENGLVEVDRLEWTGDSEEKALDFVVREEPLEIRIQGVSIAVLMRTPGDDKDLVRGFLLTEGIVTSSADIESIRHCSIGDVPEAEDNVIKVLLRAGIELEMERFRRNFYASSSCGICGKASIEQVMQEVPPSVDGPRIKYSVFYGLPESLRIEQKLFEHCGGLHAMALFGSTGELWDVHEDVGRHNAADKVIGRAALQGRDFGECLLFVSGRVSFEIVQKAAMVGITVIAAISAPSSLAIGLARERGITLLAFVREQRMCVYSHGHRVTH